MKLRLTGKFTGTIELVTSGGEMLTCSQDSNSWLITGASDTERRRDDRGVAGVWICKTTSPDAHSTTDTGTRSPDAETDGLISLVKL